MYQFIHITNGYVRIRHYGFLASRNKADELNRAKKELGQSPWVKVNYSWQVIAKEKLGYNPDLCGHCGKETMAIVKVMAPKRGPPIHKLMHA